MRRILVVLVAFSLFSLSGCDLIGLIGSKEQADPEAMPKVYKSTAPQIMFDKIMSALDSEDSETLKSLFAPNAIVKESDLDDQIIDLMQLYKGKLVSNSAFDSGSSIGEMLDGDYVYLCIRPVIREMITDSAVYLLRFDSVPANNETPDDIGLWCILLQLKDGEDVRGECFVGTWYPGRDN